ncbi:hypothetical protein PDE_05979 [Penicillium oxalicum 114-2]|uniref:Uncharacterized protein n=1 Tax=Penicillium oxalicum (strain 114-2 / CGMCC 5302) TaxID=933388 RepID=S7ZK67_PENO1|nr:hypothetical protein PDE_05979 [Penicillium oxalicum 114-2]
MGNAASPPPSPLLPTANAERPFASMCSRAVHDQGQWDIAGSRRGGGRTGTAIVAALEYTTGDGSADCDRPRRGCANDLAQLVVNLLGSLHMNLATADSVAVARLRFTSAISPVKRQAHCFATLGGSREVVGHRVRFGKCDRHWCDMHTKLMITDRLERVVPAPCSAVAGAPPQQGNSPGVANEPPMRTNQDISELGQELLPVFFGFLKGGY